MSVISDFHTAELYTGKNKPADETQRLSIISFKTPKDKKDDANYKRPDARCISIPQLKVHTTPDVLQLALQTAFEELQDAVIRRIIVEKLDAGVNVITVHNDQINFNAIALYAAEVATAGKLTRDAITEWFDTDIADVLTLALAEAMKLPATPTTEQEQKLAAAVTNYRTIFATLAAPKAGLSPKIAKQLQRVLERCEDKEDRVYRSLAAKITSHIEAKEPELVGL